MNIERFLLSVLGITLAFLAAMSIWGCEGPPITGTDVPTSTFSSARNQPPRETPPNFAPSPQNPRQAKGRLIIEGDYGTCIQSTTYPLDYMSVFTVGSNGSQAPYAGSPYKSGEGSIPCGIGVQVDCTVRDPSPTPNAISAYDLYASFIGTVECTPPPGCVEDCTPPPCEDGEWVEVDREVSYEGRCEQRVKVTRVVLHHSCTGKEKVETTRESEPNECSSDACILPNAGSGELSPGNPSAECGQFGLVPGSGGFYISKCGLFYEWGASPVVGVCSNGQDVSHVTECQCPEDD